MTKFKRFLVIFVSLSLAYFLQLVAFPSIQYLNIVPNILLIEVLSVGFLYGRAYGLGVGFLAGLLLDILGNGTICFYALIYTWLGYLDGILSEKMDSEVLVILFLLLLANELFFHLYIFAGAFLIQRSFVFTTYVTEVFVPEFLMTLLLFIPIYGFLAYISRRWDLRVQKGEIRIAA